MSKTIEISRELRSTLAMIMNALDRDAAEGKQVRGEMAAELRALLAAPAVPAKCHCAPLCYLSDSSCPVHGRKPAAERQEPVAWLMMALGSDGEIYRKSTTSTEPSLRDARYCWGQGVIDRFKIVIEPLYTSQPAPVAVIYQTQYLGDGGGGWCDVEREEYERDSKRPNYRTRTVTCIDNGKELNQN